MDPEIQAALDALRNALAARQGRRVLFLHLLYSDGTADMVSVPGVSVQPAAERQTIPTPPADTPDVERDILGVLARAESPLKGSAIAGRCGRSYSSHFRETLSRLVREGRIVRPPGGGYWPADRQSPTNRQEAPDVTDGGGRG